MVKKKKKKANLSGDVVEANILTRLPVKTLIQFRSVCKSWYSLISSPYFINTHNQIQKNKISNLHVVDYRHENRIFVKDSCLPEQSPLFSFSFNDRCDFPFKFVAVVGCYNGVVCVSTSSIIPVEFSTIYRISLWNPALRINKIISEEKLLGRWDAENRMNYRHREIVAGYLSARLYQCVAFGYHNQTNDYNVIKFSTDFLTIKDVEIYSLASDSWRKIELGPNQLRSRSQRNKVERFGVYVSYCSSEAYCWLASKVDEKGNYLGESWIISLHMKDEAFKELMLPNNTKYNIALFCYRDSLALLQTRYSGGTIFHTKFCYIWVLKDYDDSKSWTKLYKFDSQCFCVSLLGVIDTDQILLQTCHSLNEELNVVVIDKSQMKPITYTNDFNKAKWISSFTESLALVEGVHSDFPV